MSDRLIRTQIPNFFLVGAPRCGTTALHTYLSQHPDIFIPKVKESLHFGTDLIREGDYYYERERYLALFTGVADEKLIGESSVFYLYSKLAAQKIHNFNSNAKIIVMLRNPVELLPSYHSRLLYKGDEEITDIVKAIEAENVRREGQLLTTRIRFTEKLFYNEIFQFTDQLQRYFNTFGRENVRVIIYDDFKNNASRVFQETLNFLGAMPSPQTNFPIINSNKRVRSAFLRGLIRNPPTILSKLAKIALSHGMRQRMLEFTRDLNTVYTSRLPLDQSLRKFLIAKFGQESYKLSELLQRDLTHWNQ